LNVNRSTVYYKSIVNKEKKQNSHQEDLSKVLRVFDENRKKYGSRKIKKVLEAEEVIFSKRKILRLMKELGIKSCYNTKKYRNYNNAKCNGTNCSNLITRNFDGWNENEVIVSDLTYVEVNGQWNYICTLIDLFNREIVGFSVGKNKTAELVQNAFDYSNIDLAKVMIFHTDRGCEFENISIDNFLENYSILRSLSRKGCPYDNAVAESTFKIIKTEFVMGRKFSSLEKMELDFSDYVHWYNNCRIHGSLNYLTPAALKRRPL
jgi:putative transposase